eukprot:scpid96948/ scgid0917/ 
MDDDLECDSTVRRTLKPICTTSDEAKVGHFVRSLIQRIAALSATSATSNQITADQKRTLPVACAEKLVQLLKEHATDTCVTAFKVCSLSDCLRRDAVGDCVWHGGIKCQYTDTDRRRGHRPWLLLAWLTPSPHQADLFSHTPGSLFLHDDTTSVLCEVTDCRLDWVDNLVIVPSWNFASFRRMPSVTKTDSGDFDIVSGGYFELTSPLSPCLAREPPCIDTMAAMSVEELSIAAAK